MTSAVATCPGPQSKCQCHTKGRERAQREDARDTKFENQIFAINKRASRESRRRDNFQEGARLLPQSHSQSQLFPLAPSAATAAATGRHVRQRGILIIFCPDSCFFSSFSGWVLQHLPLDILFRPKLLPPLAARCAATDATTHTHTYIE